MESCLLDLILVLEIHNKHNFSEDDGQSKL